MLCTYAAINRASLTLKVAIGALLTIAGIVVLTV
jgi:hypothetical protein